MTKIHQLPSELINKIAAGEVVERPASVVKELLENALDAKATRIAVEVENAGLTKITVTDDGEGMEAIDVRKSIDRHATSKIQNLEDLTHVSTYGFRGEALSTISAVSMFTIKSKLADAPLGYQIYMRGGQIEKESGIGMPKGTQIVVTDLFYNVPARKKFLKTTSTEFRHIVDIVTHSALTHPTIGFALYHNKRPFFELAPNQQKETRIMQLIGKDTFARMKEIFLDHPHIKISGYIGVPPLFADSAQKQFLFVNGRPIRDRLIASAVREGYGTLLPPRNLPMFIIFISIPPELVDVNVHPRKEEVKFVNGNTMFSLIKGAVSHALQPEGIQFSTPTASDAINEIPQSTHKFTEHQHVSIRESALPKAAFESILSAIPKQTQIFSSPKIESSETEKHEAAIISNILQIQCLYLVFEKEDKLYIIDQHAAHERILYEQLLQQFKENLTPQQPLLLPLKIETTASEQLIFEEHKHILEKLGFAFGESGLTLTHVPTLLAQKQIDRVLKEMLSDLSEEKEVRSIDNQSQKMIASLACRSSVMAGEELSSDTRRFIVTQLFQIPNYLTCPHGRPTHLIYSMQDLAKLFKRI